MLIVDAHLDLAWNALQWERDLTLSAHTTRTQEVATAGFGRGQGTVALPDLRRGRVALCFATTLARATGTPMPSLDYRSPAQAYATAQGQIAYYRALEHLGHLRVVGDAAALQQHMAAWKAWETQGALADDAPPLGVVISMESADPILDPDQLPAWWAAGVRLIGPTHYGPGRYAGGTGTEQGLSDTGVALLDGMRRLGIVLDLTHLSDPAFWQAVERFDGPVIASHNNCRALVPHQRQFSDDQLRAIIARGGVVGLALDIWMLEFGWTLGVSPNTRVSLATAVDHIDHICQLAGTSTYVGIGSDLDGGFGREQSPHDLDTIADLQQLVGLLEQRGYKHDDIANILHRNWLRVLEGAWGGAR